MNEKRKRLLIELEMIVGNEFYNADIQNWGPGRVVQRRGPRAPLSDHYVGQARQDHLFR